MFKLPFWNKKEFKLHPVVLVVLDGFGLAPPSRGNAISLAKKPFFDYLMQEFPHTQLIASGESVGLPANEVGNTEVGHLILGAGRIIFQDLKRIDLAIEKGSFYNNQAILKTIEHARKNSSKLHILGLVSSGKVHSSISHLYALLQFCKKEDFKNVFLHIFTDGRDAPPKEGIEIVSALEEHLRLMKLGKIASVCGRYFAMDRDRRWARTERAYKAIVLGEGQKAVSAKQALEQAYSKNITDEFIEPTVIVNADATPISTIDDNDAVVFFNFRIDRPRQLVMALCLPNFETIKTFDFGYNVEKSREEGTVVLGETFKREKVPKNLFVTTFTEYHKNIPVSAVAFPPEVVENSLAQVLSENGLRQLHMAESEKERFVTYYFDGLREKRFSQEDVLIVPSAKVSTYDKKPEMSLPDLSSRFISSLERDYYHFVLVNIANPDMVAHSGDLSATIKAIEIVDFYLKKMVEQVLRVGGIAFITGDHGNAEELLTFPSISYFYTSKEGVINTDHSNNPVPLIVVAKEFQGKNSELPKGELSDVAPTILKVMGLQVPEVMTGKNLLLSI